MKKIFTIIFSLAVSIAATAQTAAEIEICQQAETAYRIGRFDEAVSLLKDNMARLTSRTRSTAYHLLSLCYMEKDNSDEATRYASLLLKENPYFTPTLSDPLRFIDLIESMKRGKSATITTASQQAESIDESPVPVTLITEDMIKASGAKNFRDLLMTFVPGITPLEGEECNVSMRGIYALSQENILIMRDGHRLNSYATNSIAPDYRIALNNIKQIEVLRGPASSLYGNVALTSVVNIITKSGSDVNGLRATYGMGDNNTYKGEILFGKGFIDSEILIWGSLYASDGYKYNISPDDEDFYGLIKKDGTMYVDGYNNKPAFDFGMKYRWKDLTLTLSHQHGKRVQAYNSLYFYSLYDYDKYSKINGTKPGRSVTTTNAIADYTISLNDNTSLSASLSCNFEKTDIYSVLGDSLPYPYSNIGLVLHPTNPYIKDSLIISRGAFCVQGWDNVNVEGEIRLANSYKLGKAKGTILVGAQMGCFNSHYNYLSIGANYDGVIMTAINDENSVYKNGKENSFSVYGQIKHYFSPKVILNGGLRYDHKKRYDDREMNVISPRMALIYIPNEKWNTKLSYAHSYVDASFFYRASSTLYLGNTDLNPQHMDSYQLSSTIKITPNLVYNGNIFYNHSSDIVVMNLGSAKESGTLDMFGLESILSFNKSHTIATTNLIFQKKIKAKNYMTTSSHVNAVPDFVCHAMIEKELHFLVKGLWFGTHVSYTTKQLGQMASNFVYKGVESLANQQYEIPSACIVDGSIRYYHQNYELSFKCYNLLNSQFRLSGHRTPILQQGRNFLATLSINLH